MTFWGVFHGEFFLFCTKWFSGHGVKKNWGFTTFKGGGAGPKLWNFTIFFFFKWILPLSIWLWTYVSWLVTFNKLCLQIFSFGQKVHFFRWYCNIQARSKKFVHVRKWALSLTFNFLANSSSNWNSKEICLSEDSKTVINFWI